MTIEWGAVVVAINVALCILWPLVWLSHRLVMRDHAGLVLAGVRQATFAAVLVSAVVGLPTSLGFLDGDVLPRQVVVWLGAAWRAGSLACALYALAAIAQAERRPE